METVDIRINDIRVYEKNPRRNDHAVAKTAEAIQEFGFLVPIIIDSDNIIIDGHLRLKAAKQLGMESVPCVVARELDPVKLKALRLSVNRIANEAGWDVDLLKMEITDLVNSNYEINLTGFDEEEIDSILEGLAEPQDITGYEPVLRPEASTASITDADVEKKQAELQDKYKDVGDKDFDEIMCPHCGGSFWLD